MKIAAIRYSADQGAVVDDLLVRLAAALQERGVRLCGAVQHNQNDGDRRCDGMELEDPATGERVLICETIDEGSANCRIDEDALAKAIAWAEQGLSAGADLLIINKFGKREAAGRGFAPVIRAAVNAGLPVLVGVSDRNLDAWTAIAGGQSISLTAEFAAMMNWCELNVAAQQERAVAADH